MSPVRVPVAVLARAQAALGDLRADAEVLIGGRAALLGLAPDGRISAGGATRLLAGPDGWCALTLSRPDDVDAVPALLGADDLPDDMWSAIGRVIAETGVWVFAERARLLGLPVGVLGEATEVPTALCRNGERKAFGDLNGLLVADLSSMWAGPLCGRLLSDAGATVVKVETRTRPDGTRQGSAAFFDWMNSGKLSYAADLEDPGLRRLLGAADVVIESSRPAALQRRGLGPTDVAGPAGRVWVRITGHGTDGARADWVAFGDDAAVSGGLVSGSPADPRFCGDAIADPLTGIRAAAEVLASRRRGGGELIELSMAGVAAEYAQLPRGDEKPCVATPVAAPRGPALGADNAAVDRLVADRATLPC
ncbi:CoA transferase [Mycolicibacterium gilvum]|uniref:CoA transferase n=1 Tax=Mycolicibacterium gilvum TaxID=1804 RepID=UPI000E1C2370|nr:CoA transferase [Mycolicibacterium gilvum]MCV7056005.1 CoA transferase [Mycolicibacterium gilvum]